VVEIDYKEKEMKINEGGYLEFFYFSHFPKDFQEYDLWRVFMKWGKVWEVFIAKRRDKGDITLIL